MRIGGYEQTAQSPAVHYDTVYSTDNGTEWRLDNVSAGFGDLSVDPAAPAAGIQYGGQLHYFVGGLGAWATSDGVSWANTVNMPLWGAEGAISHIALGIHEGWLHAAFRHPGTTTVWRSKDGMNWSPVSSATEWGTDVDAIVSFDGSVRFISSDLRQTISSRDGRCWSAQLLPLQFRQAYSLGGKVWGLTSSPYLGDFSLRYVVSSYNM
mgnify:CR=1 FL=1